MELQAKEEKDIQELIKEEPKDGRCHLDKTWRQIIPESRFDDEKRVPERLEL